MKRRSVLASLIVAALFSLSWQSAICPHEKPGKAKPKSNPIEGDWIEILWEGFMGGGTISVHNPNDLDNPPVEWRINKETIERGPVKEGLFPRTRYSYKLNPGSEEGAIDLTTIVRVKDKKTKKLKDEIMTRLGIYFVKDDYMLINLGWDSRPKNFSSPKGIASESWLIFLRRCNSKDGPRKGVGTAPK